MQSVAATPSFSPSKSTLSALLPLLHWTSQSHDELQLAELFSRVNIYFFRLRSQSDLGNEVAEIIVLNAA